MTQREELVNVLNALNSLSIETLNSLSDEELKKLREMITEKNTIISAIIKGRLHCKHYCFPVKDK